MELMQQVKGNYCTDRREEAEDEGTREIITPTREAETNSTRLQEEDGAAASNLRKHLDMMELSLGSNKEVEGGYDDGENGCSSMMMMMKEKKKEEVVEKEHMFDKVVTPSDVGKLNRLVIPKQHAEKYFPLDSSSNEKGLLLNFEDRNGKVWRFRYSYWNSSQSYVMTKGWSRFVKEKKLDAGDIVSFQRGLSDLYRHRLYIDWRPRHAPLSHPHIPFFPCPTLPSTISHHPHPHPHPHHRFHFHHHLNYSNIFTTFHQQHQQHYLYAHLNSGSAALPPPSLFSSSSSSSSMPSVPASDRVPIIIDSVPVAHHHHHHHHQHGSPIVSGASATTNTGKRLRLFGVNMECASSAQGSEPSSSSSSSSLPRFRDYEDRLSLSGRFGGQRGGRAFDLDPSLH